MRWAAPILGLALAVLAACGDEAPTPAPPALPETPEAFLAWVREAETADDLVAVRDRLAAWPLDDPAFADAEETQVALTWRLRVVLDWGDSTEALGTFDVLTERFDGGLTPEGKHLPYQLLRAGLVDGLLDAFAQSVEGGYANLEALSDLEPYLSLPEERSRVVLLRQWASLTRLAQLGLELEPHDGPRVLVLSDHFALGETILPSTLARWQRTLGPLGLRVSIIPTPSGSVRVGIRRAPAPAHEELTAIRARGEELDVTTERPFHGRGKSLGAILESLGVRVAVFVVDRKGQIVARLTGVATLEPFVLEEAVERVSTR